MRAALPLALAAALVLPAAAPAAGADGAGPPADTGPPSAARPGDGELSCDQLSAEAAAQAARIEAESREAQRLAMAQMAGMGARQQVRNLAGTALSGLASTLLPGVGSLLGAGIDALASSALQPNDPAAEVMSTLAPLVQRLTEASERLRHLQGLYVDRCLEGGAPSPAAPGR